MTRAEAKKRLLEVVDAVERPEDLIRGLYGGPGCLVERVFGLVEKDPDGFFPYRRPDYDACLMVGIEPQKVWGPSDAYAEGAITKEELRRRIERL